MRPRLARLLHRLARRIYTPPPLQMTLRIDENLVLAAWERRRDERREPDEQ